MSIIDFKAKKCKHCYKCVRNCPVKSITVRDGRAEIQEDKCILCGTCLKICPQSAKSLTSDLDLVKGFIRDNQRVIVSVAPSYLGVLKYHTPGQVKAALKKLGFLDVRETSEGAILVTEEYNRLMAEGTMENIISTCCPSVNDLIEMYYPQLVPYMAPVDSPMIAHAKILRKEYGDDIKVVFLGPCIAKKKEAEDPRNKGCIDAVLNFRDLKRWLTEESIEIESCPNEPFDHIDPKVNRLYPVGNGVISAVLADTSAQNVYRKFYVHGAASCMELLKNLSEGEIQSCFIEMNMCDGGCIKGPTINTDEVYHYKARLNMEAMVPPVPVSRYTVAALQEGISLSKEFSDHSPKDAQPSEAQILDVLKKTGKFKPEDELNCGACGYPTCRDKAIAVCQGKAELEMCIPYMHEKAQSLSNVVLQTSPNLIMIVDKDLRIREYSASCEQHFRKSRTEALQMYLFEFMDAADFQWVYEHHQDIVGRKATLSHYGMNVIQNIMYMPEQDMVMAIMIDVTEEEARKQQEFERNLATIDLAQNVIRKQMMVAQEIAGLLGETTADTKTTLTRLCQSLLGEDDGGEDNR